MSPAKDPPDPHTSIAEQKEYNRVLCYVCETDLIGKGAGIDDESTEPRTKDKKGKLGLVEINSEGTGFAGGGKNMATREGVAFQC